jgi:hypothetical protein
VRLRSRGNSCRRRDVAAAPQPLPPAGALQQYPGRCQIACFVVVGDTVVYLQRRGEEQGETLFELGRPNGQGDRPARACSCHQLGGCWPCGLLMAGRPGIVSCGNRYEWPTALWGSRD